MGNDKKLKPYFILYHIYFEGYLLFMIIGNVFIYNTPVRCFFKAIISVTTVEKGSLMHTDSQPSLSHIRMSPGPLLLTQRSSVLTACAGYHLAWEYLSVSDSMCAALFYFSVCAYGGWYTPLLNLSPEWRWQGPLSCGTREVCAGQLPCVGCQEGLAGHGTNTHNWSWSCSACSVSKALFHLVLNCIVFSLLILISRCNGAKVLRLLFLMTGDSYHLPNTNNEWFKEK